MGVCTSWYAALPLPARRSVIIVSGILNLAWLLSICLFQFLLRISFLQLSSSVSFQGVEILNQFLI